MTFEIPDQIRLELESRGAAPLDEEVRGAYFGRGATATEVESGVAVEKENAGELRPGGAGHRALATFGEFGSRRVTALRREATRLLVRGFLAKDGVLPNPAPRGRPHVDAYVLTDAGRAELDRLGPLA